MSLTGRLLAALACSALDLRILLFRTGTGACTSRAFPYNKIVVRVVPPLIEAMAGMSSREQLTT